MGGYKGIESSVISGGSSNNMFDNMYDSNNGFGLGVINLRRNTDNGYTPGSTGMASAEDTANLDYRNLMNENLRTSIDLNKQQLAGATGANAPKWADVQGVGGAFDWLTANRGGGSNYLNTGLGVVNAGVDLWSAYNKNKYEKKMAGIADRAQGLQERQQSLYEDQLKKQEAKQAKAQKAYDDAQNLRM